MGFSLFRPLVMRCEVRGGLSGSLIGDGGMWGPLRIARMREWKGILALVFVSRARRLYPRFHGQTNRIDQCEMRSDVSRHVTETFCGPLLSLLRVYFQFIVDGLWVRLENKGFGQRVFKKRTERG